MAKMYIKRCTTSLIVRKCNQNHNVKSPHTLRLLFKTKPKNNSVSKDVKKREAWFAVGGNVNW